MIRPRPSRGPRSLFPKYSQLLKLFANFRGKMVFNSLLIHHHSQFRLLAAVDAMKVHIQDSLNLFVCKLMCESTQASNAGIVQSDVQASPRVDNLRYSIVDGRLVSHVHVE